MGEADRDLTLAAAAPYSILDRRAALLADLCREAGGRLRGLTAALREDREAPFPAELYGRLRAGLLPDLRRLTEALSPAVVEMGRRDRAAEVERAEHERFYGALHASQVYVGDSAPPSTWSVLGTCAGTGRPVAVSRDRGQVVLLVGMPGYGKSVFATNLVETTVSPFLGLTSPEHRRGAVVTFSPDPDGSAIPDIISGLRRNPREEDLALLWQRLGVHKPAGIPRMNVVVPPWMLEEYRARLRPFFELGLRLLPLRVPLHEYGLPAVEVALGAGARGEAQYVQHLLSEIQDGGPRLGLGDLHRHIDEAQDLPQNLKAAAHRRLRLLDKIVVPAGAASLWDAVEPGVVTVFIVTGRQIGRWDTVPLIVGLVSALSRPSERHGKFSRLFLLDEMNRFDHEPLVLSHLLTTARQIRHRGSWLVLCAQDLLWLPEELFGLATMMGTFRVQNPQVFEHVRARWAGYAGHGAREVAELPRGTLLLSAAESSCPEWHGRARLLRARPLCCERGGATKAEI